VAFWAGGDGVKKSPEHSAQRACGIGLEIQPDKLNRQIHQEDDPNEFEQGGG
jgi:hypothetical protein